MDVTNEAVGTEFDLAITDRLLTTTRSVRKRLDLKRPVPQEIIDESLRIGLQAATGGDLQRWRWVIVRDADKRRQIGEIYKRSFLEMLGSTEPEADAAVVPESESTLTESDDQKRHEKFNEDIASMDKLMGSVDVLIQRMSEVPVIVIPCVIGRADGDVTPSWVSSQYGSVYPAVWNFLLALRSRGLGSCITAAHLEYEREVADIIGVPYDDVMQVCALPVAYYTGTTFRQAKRRPQSEVVFVDTFDASTMDSTGW